MSGGQNCMFAIWIDHYYFLLGVWNTNIHKSYSLAA